MSFADAILPLLTLIVLEVILGIDNIIFISILADKAPAEQRGRIRTIGLLAAMGMRLILLALIAWIMKLDRALFYIQDYSITGKELILLGGGLFLLYKSTREIFLHTEHATHREDKMIQKGMSSFGQMVLQILLLDIVFSIDSIITAVGMVKELWIMYAAVIVSVTIMLFASKPIGDFISKHPSFKILALCFLLIIGISLIGEGLEFHIPKGYIYFSMAFAFFVDFVQLKTIKDRKPSLAEEVHGNKENGGKN